MDGGVWLVGMLEGWMFRMYTDDTMSSAAAGGWMCLWLWKGLSHSVFPMKGELLPEV